MTPTPEDPNETIANLRAELEEAQEARRLADDRSYAYEHAKNGLESDVADLRSALAQANETISYVTLQLIAAGLDDGASPVEQMARRAVRNAEKLATAERERDEAMVVIQTKLDHPAWDFPITCGAEKAVANHQKK